MITFGCWVLIINLEKVFDCYNYIDNVIWCCYVINERWCFVCISLVVYGVWIFELCDTCMWICIIVVVMVVFWRGNYIVVCYLCFDVVYGTLYDWLLWSLCLHYELIKLMCCLKYNYVEMNYQHVCVALLTDNVHFVIFGVM